MPANFHAKAAPFAQLAFERDAAAEHFNETAGDGQAQARAALLARAGRVDLGERLKQNLLIIRRDTDTGVDHFNLEGGHSCPPITRGFKNPRPKAFKQVIVPDKSGDDLDATALGKFYRIAYEVGQNTHKKSAFRG